MRCRLTWSIRSAAMRRRLKLIQCKKSRPEVILSTMFFSKIPSIIRDCLFRKTAGWCSNRTERTVGPVRVLLPDSQSLQLARGHAGPITIRRRAGRAWVQNASYAGWAARECGFCAFGGEISHAHQPVRFQDAHQLAQVFVARLEQGRAFGRTKLVWRAIPARTFDKYKRTIIYDEVFPGEIFGGAKVCGE